MTTTTETPTAPAAAPSFTLSQQPNGSWWVTCSDGRVYRAGDDLVELWGAYQKLRASYDLFAEESAKETANSAAIAAVQIPQEILKASQPGATFSSREVALQQFAGKKGGKR